MIALGDWLDARGYSIGFTHLGFRGVTIAGAAGTSAHGSSPSENNAVAQRLRSLKVALADGSLRTFTAADAAWRALQTSLGLLGVVVELGVRVEPALRIAVDVTLHDEGELLSADSPLALLEGCDWGQFNWFPHHRKFFRWCGKRTLEAADGHPDNTLLDPGVSADLAPLAKLAFHAGTCGDALNELVENARFDGLSSAPPILIDRGAERVHVDRAVGPAHRLTSADLISLGEHKYFQMDWEVAVPQQFMHDALQAARATFDAHDVSLPGVGAFLRFGKIERGGWLSYHSAGKEFAEGQSAMFFETPVAVPAGYSADELDDYLHVYRGLIELFIRHFGARAHWGKNLDAIFDLQRQLGTYDGRLDMFNQAIARLDPGGVFKNAFATRIGVVYPSGSATNKATPSTTR
jgi:FAD/FMN-containing dehydrogenase